MMKTTEQTIKSILRSAAEDQQIKIIEFQLFGSRARGTFSSGSDWDILVLTARDLTHPQKHDYIVTTKRELAKRGIPNDIIVKSKDQYEIQRSITGSLAWFIQSESVAL